jgi:hypothetical protein
MITFLDNYNNTNIIKELLYYKNIPYCLIELLFSFIGIIDLIKVNIIIKRRFIKHIELEIIKKDRYLNILNNLGNILNKWKTDIYPKNFRTTASMLANNNNCDDCLDPECNCEPWLCYIWPLIIKYEDGVQDIRTDIFNGYNFVQCLRENNCSSDLIELIKITKIYSEISLKKKKWLLSKYSNEICDLRIPLGDIHNEIKGISKEWRIWRGKINVVLCEMVRYRIILRKLN